MTKYFGCGRVLLLLLFDVGDPRVEANRKSENRPDRKPNPSTLTQNNEMEMRLSTRNNVKGIKSSKVESRGGDGNKNTVYVGVWGMRWYYHLNFS
jgi:hypothetical protein